MISPYFERNLGFLCEAEQERLQDSTIAIAGGGGDGGEIARLLTRMGAGAGSGEIRLADPEMFEDQNINRQTACTSKTIGVNKAVAVGDLLKNINPDINLKLFTDGVTQENVDEFVDGADLVIDESEFTLHSIAVMLNRAARPRKIPVLMGLNLGFGCVVTTYHPNGTPFEHQLGFRTDQPIDEIASIKVPVRRWAPYLPKYGDFRVLTEVNEGKKPVPSIAPGMAVAASTTTTEALWNLFDGKNHRPKPIYFRSALVVDPGARIAKKIRWNQFSYARHGASIWVRNRFGYPKTDF